MARDMVGSFRSASRKFSIAARVSFGSFSLPMRGRMCRSTCCSVLPQCGALDRTPVAHAVGLDTAHPDARCVGHGDVRDDEILPVADSDLRLFLVGYGVAFVLEPHLVPAAIAVGVIGNPPRRFLRCAGVAGSSCGLTPVCLP